jgi:hypothetical protein
MADKKISELTSIVGSDVDDANDTVAIVDSSAGQTKKITREELFDTNTDASINGLTVGRGSGDVSTNTVVGLEALESNTTGTNNVAVGRQSMENNTEGDFNLALGYRALRNNIDGSNNTTVGREALQDATTANNNTALGWDALGSVTTGSFNVGIGRRSGNAITTGDNNTTLGNDAQVLDPTANGQISIAADGTKWMSATGSPEGVVSASVGSMYTDKSGGTGTTLYVKESGSGNTGWVAK